MNDLTIMRATEEIIAIVQEEIDTWLADNDLTLEFDTIYLEGLVEEILEKALEE